jgi:D-amino peptidase
MRSSNEKRGVNQARWIAGFATVVLALAAAPAAQPGKRIYLSVDMEGISGISGSDQLSSAQPEYGRSRKLMAEDVNAAIRGALEAGATDVVVNDSHGSHRNILPEDLHPSARLITVGFKPFGMMEGLDETFDAVMFIGYHAKAESPRGVFPHTGTGVTRDVRINGRSVGEGGLNALLAAWYGIPVVLVTGDDVAVAQVREVATSARGVAVKRAINVRGLDLKPLTVARKEIEAAAREAVAGASKGTADRAASYRVEVQFKETLIPEIVEAFPSMERPAPDTVAFTAKTMPAAHRLVRVLYRYINPN